MAFEYLVFSCGKIRSYGSVGGVCHWREDGSLEAHTFQVVSLFFLLDVGEVRSQLFLLSFPAKMDWYPGT